jgi:hypothetical protein
MNYLLDNLEFQQHRHLDFLKLKHQEMFLAHNNYGLRIRPLILRYIL